MGIKEAIQEKRQREREMKCGNQVERPREREKNEVWESRKLSKRRDKEREG